MKIHFVGGFLGSGKTTAIAGACALLISGGEKVGVVTNDIGKYQVDSRFLNSSGIPTAEVSGACICGRYDDFLERLEALAAKDRPGTVFVELIGSSVGMADSIRRGLASYGETGTAGGNEGGATLSVIADFRLMAAWLAGTPLPFSADLVYLFERQLAEADLLALNKIDLAGEKSLTETLDRARKRFPALNIVPLSFRQPGGASKWLSALGGRAGGEKPTRFRLPFDPARYDRAERSLSWLESELEFAQEGSGDAGITMSATLNLFFETLWNYFSVHSVLPGHVKALVTDVRDGDAGHSAKVGFSSADELYPLTEKDFSGIRGARIDMLLNARVLAPPETVSAALDAALEALEKSASARVRVRVREKGRAVRSPSAAAPSRPSSSLRAPLPQRP